MNNKPYRLEGPPRLLLRLLAPLLVAPTLTLFGSGVALLIVGHGGGPLLQLHAVSFAVWGVLVAVHILAYLTRVLRVGVADWRRQPTPSVPGDRSRRAALLGAVLAGVILALATYPAQQAWLDHGTSTTTTVPRTLRPARRDASEARIVGGGTGDALRHDLGGADTR